MMIGDPTMRHTEDSIRSLECTDTIHDNLDVKANGQVIGNACQDAFGRER